MRFILFIILFLFYSASTSADTTLVATKDSLKIKTNVHKPESLIVKTTTPEILKIKPVQLRHQSTELWIFIVCCLTFLLAGINRRIDEKKHDQSILGFFKIGAIGHATDRSFYEFNIHQLIGLIVHNLILALWTFYFLRETEYQFVDNNLLFYILLFFLISLIYLFKFFFQYLALNILQINDLPVLLIKCTIGLGYFTMLVTLPLFMVVYYIQYPEWYNLFVGIFITVMGAYLTFRVFKYFQLFIQFFGASIFYNILYLCGLELIPLFVFIKICTGIF